MSEPCPAPAPAPPPETARRVVAWQPFTPKGIAAFAPASFGRLFAAQVIAALLAAAAVVWFLSTVWFPAAREAIRNLPSQGAIRAGNLEVPVWTGDRLVTNRFLGFALDPGVPRSQTFSSDVFVILRHGYFRVCSLFGCADFRYPVASSPFSRLEMEAKWGAWEPFLLGIAALGVALGVLASWWLLASLYFIFVWTLAYFADRELTIGGSWRLCGAALLAGALLLTAGIVAYGLGGLDLLQLLIVAALHSIVPLVLIVLAVFQLPRIAGKKPNPFAHATQPQA